LPGRRIRLSGRPAVGLPSEIRRREGEGVMATVRWGVLWAVAVLGAAAAALDRPMHADVDSDGDGLSDFQEVHKYFTDPKRRSTAGTGVSDGEWDERREFTYSVRTVVRVMPPYHLAAVNDDYQDARVRQETKDFVELEVISYPLNTNAEAITANPDWKRDYAGMTEYLRPGVTTNWDESMGKELLSELSQSGIDPNRLTDRELVEKVSGWLFRRCKYRPMFGTMFVGFAGDKPSVLPGLDSAFDREKGDPKWTVQEQFDHELLGRGMFGHRTCGSCTSSAVLLTTVLRALGIPTRMVLAIPVADVNDPEQLALVEKGLRHHRVRAEVLDGLLGVGRGFVSHTFNEVFVGNRWRRLNYSKLGQNVLDRKNFGLMIHVHTFNDLSEANLGPTWGRRFALGLRDENFKTSNPYRTLEVSDHFGREARVPNPPADEKEHRALTISRAYWLGSKETPEVIRQTARPPHAGEGHLYVHADEWFPDQDHVQYKKFMARADRKFVLRAAGQPDVNAELQMSFWTDGRAGLREILVVIPADQLARMAKGVAYTLHPVNTNPDYHWKIKEGLTVTREDAKSVEDKLEALRERVEKLEKRLEEFEKKKGGGEPAGKE
jgi:hypothetical protein